MARPRKGDDWKPVWREYWFAMARKLTPVEQSVVLNIYFLTQNETKIGDILGQSWSRTDCASQIPVPKSSTIRAISRLIKLGFISEDNDGTMHLTFYKDWVLSKRQESRLSPDEIPEFTDTMSENEKKYSDTKEIDKIRIEKRREEKRREETKPTGGAAIDDYFDKHSTDEFPTDSQAMLSRRAAIFWYFWEFAIPKYTANPKDADKVIHMVTRKETFLEILNYIPWFILYETDDWLKKNRLLKTIRGLSMRIDGYHNLSRKDDKWQDAKSKMRSTAEAMKEERPKLHQYLTKLSKSSSTSSAKNSTDK